MFNLYVSAGGVEIDALSVCAADVFCGDVNAGVAEVVAGELDILFAYLKGLVRNVGGVYDAGTAVEFGTEVLRLRVSEIGQFEQLFDGVCAIFPWLCASGIGEFVGKNEVVHAAVLLLFVVDTYCDAGTEQSGDAAGAARKVQISWQEKNVVRHHVVSLLLSSNRC